MLFCKDQEAKKNISYKNIYQAVFKYDKNIIFNYKKINKINKITFEDYFFNYCCDLRLKTLANKKKISSFRLLDNKQHSIKFKHLKFKKKFFRYKINFFLKKKHKLLSLNLSNFYLFRNSYVRV